METSEYVPVTEALRNPEFAPAHRVDLNLQTGGKLEQIIPLGFSTAEDFNLFEYIDANGKIQKISINEVAGLEVGGLHERDGKRSRAITVHYFSPKTGQLEDEKREIIVKEIRYGIHPNHVALGEKPDYYFVTDDSQYETNGERHFPFWRLGLYGKPDIQTKHFMNPV